VVDAARLRRASDIAAVRSVGRVVSDPRFTLHFRANEYGTLRLAVSATREVGTAVRRNRARRRLREAMRELLRGRAAAPAVDLLAAARRGTLDAPAAELRAAVARSLEDALGFAR